ncbi:MAG: PD-(D/E)XK nuclease family protein [Panacagrimonas sp.]
MTRARDLMILGLGKTEWNDDSWLGVSGASWLMDSVQDGKPLLPAKMKIPSLAGACRVAKIESSSRAAPATLNWFSAPAATRQPLPLYVSPSSAEPRPCTVSAPISVGPAVPFATGFDLADVGTAIHAVMAAGLGPSGPLTAEETSDLLRRNGVGGCVDPARLRDFALAMRNWVANTWPDAKVQAELPVRVAASGGQIVREQIDLLVVTKDEHIILDFKSGLRQFAEGSEVVQAYAGQLAAYAKAISSIAPDKSTREFLVSVSTGKAAAIGGVR